MLTGNFSWLNFLTIVLSVSTFSDATLTAVFPVTVPATTPVPVGLEVGVLLVTALVLLLSYYPIRNLLSNDQRMNWAFDPLHIVNTYGAFGSITKPRYEIVLQGTHDDEITPDTEWETYQFEGKPTDTDRRPPQWAPYHLRLDWQLWLAAMTSSPRRDPWFYHLLAKLLDGDEAVSELLYRDPFPDEPPTYVRAERYRYEFTTPEERAETGQWWTRRRVGTYVDPVSFEDPQFTRLLERRGWR